jgi:hypothetical protein
MLMGLYHNFSGKLVGKMQQNATLSNPFSAASSRQEMEGADPPGSDAGHKAFWRTEKVHRSCDPEGSDRSVAADGGKRAFCPRSGGFFVSGRQRFLKTQPNCKKSYNFLIKKGGFPLTALL